MTSQPTVLASRKVQVIISIEEEADGDYVASALGESIFTQADNLETLKSKIKDAVDVIC
ncbi:hypothetical protein [Synechococcus sp. PCC 6312]|uniref:hypothetical protein n=1 Tax=Synechococcus sp. (strain ATCC 27167 / PCC 6312) TaxID=195253 RepID=UPI00029EE47E|nr:hypothetical protein [Synechococcus sp. PCC 6312]AFY59444.1 hypothetical protein Syn6312_0202 [Synechococcus sp. PCC 6312]